MFSALTLYVLHCFRCFVSDFALFFDFANTANTMHCSYQKLLVRSVVLYPMVTLMGCLPLLVLFIFEVIHHGSNDEASYYQTKAFLMEYTAVSLTFVWTSFQGFLNSVVYFLNSGESQERWAKLLSPWFGGLLCCRCKKSDNDSFLQDEEKDR